MCILISDSSNTPSLLVNCTNIIFLSEHINVGMKGLSDDAV